jgi:extradiol dioxygenase family protein
MPQEQIQVTAKITNRQYANMVGIQKGNNDTMVIFAFLGDDNTTAIHVSNETLVNLSQKIAQYLQPGLTLAPEPTTGTETEQA